MVQILSAAIAALCLSAGIADPVSAGTFDVASCSGGGAHNDWIESNSAPIQLEMMISCPAPAGVEFGGLIVRDRLTAGDVAAGAHAAWQFAAPSGTSVGRVQLWRNAGKAENSWQLFVRTAEGIAMPDSDCTRLPHDLTCKLGGPWSAPVDWPGLSTSSVSVGVGCVDTPTTCAAGHSLHEVWTAIYRSIITINDPTPPTASGAGGTLLAGGYVRGNATATVASAADGAGIRAVQVRVDGDRVVGETQLDCDYTRRAPCDDVAAPVTVPVVTANIGDGHWTARVGVVDAGGNFTAAATRPITVDNGAPMPPPPTSPQSVTTSAPATTISWLEPAGQVSALTTAHIRVCAPSGACSTSTQPAGSGSGHATLPLADGPGAYLASVTLADAAGNHNPTYATHWSITRAPDAPGQTPGITTPTVPLTTRANARLTARRTTISRDRRTITVSGSVAPQAQGRVTITVRARAGGRTRTVTARATIRDRGYRQRLRLPSARWRRAVVTVRYLGSATHRPAAVTRTLQAAR
jgi:hypothetical protein